MKKYKDLSYSDQLKWRNRSLRFLLFLMLVYMVVVGEIGLGDTRIMTPLANAVSGIIFFGGLIWVICKIIHNNKLLKDHYLLRESMREKRDERNRALHEKSGGMVWDILFVCQLFLTTTTALINMAAFYTAVATLLLMIIIKLIFYTYQKTHEL